MKPPNDAQMLQHALRTILLVIALVGPASAQERFGPPPGPAFALFRPAPPPARPSSFIRSTGPDHGDYGLEGLAIGAIVGGVSVGSYVYRGTCDDPDWGGNCGIITLGGALVGGALGGFVGYLVGSFIPKRHSASTD